MRQAGRQGGRTSSPPPLASGQPGTSNWDVASHRRYLLPPPPPAPAIGFRQVCHHCSSAVLADSCAPSAVLTPAAGAGAAGAGDTITGALHVGQLGASQLLSHFRMHLQGRGRWRVVRHQSARHGAASRRHPTRGGRPSSCAQRAAPQRAAPPEQRGWWTSGAAGGHIGRLRATAPWPRSADPRPLFWSTLPHGLWYSCLHPRVITSCWARIVSRQMAHAGSLSASALGMVGGTVGGVGFGLGFGFGLGSGLPALPPAWQLVEHL